MFFKPTVLLAISAWACIQSVWAETVTVTVTSTVTASAAACTTTGTLNFDDIPCTSFCPFPSTYHGFVFNGASGWQVVNKAALPTTQNENKAVVSQPNALISQSTGAVSFGSRGQPFSFDVVRFNWAPFSIDGTTDIVFNMNGTTSGGGWRTYSVNVTSGINIAPYLIDLTSPQGQALNFKDLVNLSFEAWSQYGTVHQSPAVLIIDDFAYIKRLADTD